MDNNSSNVTNTIGPYRVLSTLGSGGFGVVYEVVRKIGSKPVNERKRSALKLVTVRNDAARREVEKEIEIMKIFLTEEIESSHVIKLEDSTYDSKDKRFFILLEFAPNGNLQSYFYQKLTAEAQKRKLCSVFLNIAECLCEVHSVGVLHGDVKLMNFLVVADKINNNVSNTGRDSTNELLIKISDFGLSTKIPEYDEKKKNLQLGLVSSSNSNTVTNESNNTDKDFIDDIFVTFIGIIGTVCFLAPEVVGQESDLKSRKLKTPNMVTRKIDVYSAGICLYHCTFLWWHFLTSFAV